MAQDNNRSFETSLHDIVYSIDSGTGLRIIRVALYFLFLLIIVMLYTATQFRGLKSAEAMDYAQLGRNISLNEGMITKCVRPMTMAKMSSLDARENPQIFGHPDILHPPVYPFVLGMGFKFFELIGLDPFIVPEGARTSTMPAEQWVILPVNHTFAILTGFFVFLLGRRMFSREIGFLGMTIYYLSDIAWQDSISGLNVTMAGFFIVASFYYMVVSMLNRRDTESMVRWVVPFVASVLFVSLAFLTRYISIVAVPGIALFAFMMRGKFRGGTRYALIFTFLFLIMVSPWLYRNVKVSGNPMGMALHTSLQQTEAYPDNSVERDLHAKFSMGQFESQLKTKWISNYAENYKDTVSGMGGGVLMAFFLTTFFYHFVRPQVNSFRWGLGLSMLLCIVLAGFFSDSSMMMLHAFWPFVILYGLSFFYILIDRLDLGVRLYNVGFKCLIVVVALIPLGLTLLPPHRGHPYPPYFSPIISSVSGMLTEREVMCTDMPWATAWYGDRVSILLPKDVDQFYEINDYKQYISGMYITTITKDKPFVKQLLDGPEQSWLPILSGRTPPDFPLKQAVSLNRQDQIFLSDRDRWSAGGGAEEVQ